MGLTRKHYAFVIHELCTQMSLSHLSLTIITNKAKHMGPGSKRNTVQVVVFDLTHWLKINLLTKHTVHYKRQIQATVK